jgi:hypothetical protein
MCIFMNELLNVLSVSFFPVQHLNMKVHCWIKSSEQAKFSHATTLITLYLFTVTMSHCHVGKLQSDLRHTAHSV